jgi:phage shock protein A
MLKRFSRWWRSLWGSAMDNLEDPEKILMQNIRDMENQLPVINENIAVVKANWTLLNNKLSTLQKRLVEYRDAIKAHLAAGKRDKALELAMTLERIQEDIADVERQEKMAEQAYQKALKVKEAFLAEKDQKKQEALRAIAKNKQAQWQKKVADTMASFEVGGIDATHDEMIRKIEEDVALNEARMELALGSVSVQDLDAKRESEKLHAEELLKQFELEMGVKPQAAEKTLGPKQAEAEPEAEKTIGPKEKVRE